MFIARKVVPALCLAVSMSGLAVYAASTTPPTSAEAPGPGGHHDLGPLRATGRRWPGLPARVGFRDRLVDHFCADAFAGVERAQRLEQRHLWPLVHPVRAAQIIKSFTQTNKRR